MQHFKINFDLIRTVVKMKILIIKQY